MTALLDFKQMLQAVFARYGLYLTHIGRFLLALLSLLLINGRMGYMSALKSFPIVLMAALLCSILPVGVTVAVAALFILGHLYALSLEAAAAAMLLFLLMYLLYYCFSPGDALALLLTPMLFVFHVPYVMPVALGLLRTPSAAVSMSFGVIVYYFLQYVTGSETQFGGTLGMEETAQRMQGMLSGFLSDRSMIVMIIAFAVAMLVTWLVRRMSIDHAWSIAIAAGCFSCLLCLFAGDLAYDIQISIPGAILGTLIAALVALCIQFFGFHLDYSRTERVQFEDDEYYYYVKAVPKVTVSTPKRRVKRINRAHHLSGED